jgi:transcription elongation factor GreA
MKSDIIYLDQEGYEEYLKKIEKLKYKLDEIGKDKSQSYTSAVGDGWHDNFDFEEATRQEMAVRLQIEKLREGLNNIVIVDNKKRKNSTNINDIVELDIDDGVEQVKVIYKLVAKHPDSDDEISINSPLGKSIYKKKIGSIVSYTVNNQKYMVKIVKIDNLEN